MVGDSKYGIFDDEFLPQYPLAPKSSNSVLQILSIFAWKTLFPSSQMHMCYKLYTPLWYGELLAKTTFGLKIGRGLG